MEYNTVISFNTSHELTRHLLLKKVNR